MGTIEQYDDQKGKRLPWSFYLRDDVVQISKDLIGKYLVTDFLDGKTVGRIVETEAYQGPEDRASHAFANRNTQRTHIMYYPGGHAYVYLCYGIHQMFNVVTGPQGTPHAVLIRAVEPVFNTQLMLERKGMKQLKPALGAGPGNVGKALGLHTSYSGYSLIEPAATIWIEEPLENIPDDQIIASTRVGIAYDGEDWAARPWRFRLKNSKWSSKAKGFGE
jgi:DNA-3-methyladenine glycosylase